MHALRLFASGGMLGIVFIGAVSAASAPEDKPAHFPAWWFEREVIARRPDAPARLNGPLWPEDYPTADDFAAANLGQLKHVVKQAANEIDARLPGLMGTDIVGELGGLPVDSGDNYAVINSGQLKNVADLFYARLEVLGYQGPPLELGETRPWGGGETPDDYAMANLGQLKHVFSFLLLDPNAVQPSVGDTDGDGLGDSDEIAFGLTPGNRDHDGDGLPDGWEVFFGLDPKSAVGGASDLDGDHIVSRLEYYLGRLPTKHDQDQEAKVAAGGRHTLFHKDDGNLFGWGLNRQGQAGAGYPVLTAPSTISVSGQVVALSAGLSHSLAVLSDGQVVAWGDNEFGQLGDGSRSGRSMPTVINNLTHVVEVAAGDGHSLALTGDGTVWAWGANHRGQAGSPSGSLLTTPQLVPGLQNILHISAGARNGVALDSAGNVWTWGDNGMGQLGTSATSYRAQPALVPFGATKIKALAAGRHHVLALDSAGGVWAWGGNYAGQLGLTTRTGSSGPSLLGVAPTIVGIVAGARHSLALTSSGGLVAWGANESGQLGLGAENLEDQTIPVAIPALAMVKSAAAGHAHSVALTASASLFAWGDNRESGLGVDSTTPVIAVPSAVLPAE